MCWVFWRMPKNELAENSALMKPMVAFLFRKVNKKRKVKINKNK